MANVRVGVAAGALGRIAILVGAAAAAVGLPMSYAAVGVIYQMVFFRDFLRHEKVYGICFCPSPKFPFFRRLCYFFGEESEDRALIGQKHQITNPLTRKYGGFIFSSFQVLSYNYLSFYYGRYERLRTTIADRLANDCRPTDYVRRNVYELPTAPDAPCPWRTMD